MMKKKLLALGLALVLLLSLTACGATDIVGNSQPATQGESSADAGTSSPETTQPKTEENLLTEAQAKELFDGLWERVMLANELLHNGSAACYEPGYDGPPREEVELPEGTIVTYEGKEYALRDSYLPLSHAGSSKEYAQYNTAESVHAVTRSIYTKECIERYNKLFKYVDIDGVMYGCASEFVTSISYSFDNFRILHQTANELVVAGTEELSVTGETWDVAFRLVKEDGSLKFPEKIYYPDYEENLYKQYTQQ